MEKGGVFVPITASTALPVGVGMVEHVTIAEPRQLQASGSVLRSVQDKTSPIAYGYDDSVAHYFNQAPVFRVSLAGGGGLGRGGAGSESAGWPTGRGSATDPDVPQGRPLREFEREPTLAPAERELHIEPEMRRAARRHDPARADVAACDPAMVGRKRSLGERHARGTRSSRARPP